MFHIMGGERANRMKPKSIIGDKGVMGLIVSPQNNGQGGLACCGSWGHIESDTTEQLN